MIKHFNIVWIISLFSLGGICQEKTIEKPVNWEEITNKVHQKMKLLNGEYSKLWIKGYSDLEVQFTNGVEAWKITEDKVEKYQKDNTPVFNNSSFGYSKVEGTKNAVIQVAVSEKTLKQFMPNASNEEIEKIAVSNIDSFVFHEAFHFFIQTPENEWKSVGESELSSRAVIYPSDATPRIYRNHIYTLLLKAYKDTMNSQKYLQDAKFWYTKYLNEYSDEAREVKYADRVEGTAMYVEYMSSIYNKYGLNATKENIVEYITGDIKMTHLISKPVESYELGFIAGVLLDEIDITWKKQVHFEGKALLNILFKNVSDITKEPKMEGDYIEKLMLVSKELNKGIQPVMDDFLAIYNKESKGELLFVPETQGSFVTSGFYKHSKITEPGYSIINGYKKLIKNEDGKIMINGVPLYKMPIKNNCNYKSKGVGYVILNEETKKYIDINLETRVTKNENGQIIRCVKCYEK